MVAMVRDMGLDEELVIPATLEELDLVHDWCRELLRKINITQTQEHNILLALSEAVTNAIRHGSNEDRKKRVHIGFQFQQGVITISVRDFGCGFQPDALPDPTMGERLFSTGGRGVYLLKALANQVEFHCSETGTIVTFSFTSN